MPGVKTKGKTLFVAPQKHEPCDRCGFFRETRARDEHKSKDFSYPLYFSSAHIADAKYEIVTPNGSLFLCGHHYHKHEPFIAAKGYTVIDLSDLTKDSLNEKLSQDLPALSAPVEPPAIEPGDEPDDGKPAPV